MESIRTLMQLANQNKWKLHQMDVKGAYLHVPFESDVFVQQPLGYEKHGGNFVWKLNKSLIDCDIILGVEIDSKLTFNKHIETLCSKVNKKVSAFARLNNYISREQALTVCDAVLLSNFNYCPLI